MSANPSLKLSSKALELADRARTCGPWEQARAFHETLKQGRAWESLECVGLQKGDAYDLELRNCSECGSTLARRIPHQLSAQAD